MPNYCDNKVTLIGHIDDLAAVEAAEFSFEKLHSRPANQEENWFDWNNINWGTKWDRWDYEVELKEEHLLVVNFRTAWSPPISFFTALLEKQQRSWIKCEFHTEDQLAGVWVGYMKDGILVEKGATWGEPIPYLDNEGNIYIPE